MASYEYGGVPVSKPATVAPPPEALKKGATFHLNLMIEQTDGVFVGWCIEMGLAAAAKDEQECLDKLLRLACEQASFAMENDNPQDIFHSAPSSVMSRFLMMAKQAEPRPAGDWKSKFTNQLFALSPTIYAPALV
jgi:hypothetical protein